MSTTLISFLGRSPKRDEGSYRTTDYRFDDGNSDRAAFFGFSLLRRIRPDRLIVLGTAGSMWDHLFEGDVALGEAMEAERIALIEMVEQKQVRQEQLDRLAPALGQALGCEVQLRLIPYARNESEQLEIVRTLAGAVDASTRLHLDVTHGFRHLPMLAMMALQYLRALHPGLSLEAVWYGAFDEDSGEAPVHDLAGLLHIATWSEALARFDKDGDYSTLAALMPKDAAGLLRQAAFLERTQQVGQARGRLRAAREVLSSATPSGLASLFQDALGERINWIDENRQYQRQRALALDNLRRGDHLRAVLYGYEGFITRVMTDQNTLGRDTNNYEHRQAAKYEYEDELKAARTKGLNSLATDYRLLRDIRNQLAHGVGSPRAEVQQALHDEPTLARNLRRLFNKLLPDLE